MCEKSPLGEEGRFYCPNYLCVLACNCLGFKHVFIGKQGATCRNLFLAFTFLIYYHFVLVVIAICFV
jgi:hypothetical protein